MVAVAVVRGLRGAGWLGVALGLLAGCGGARSIDEQGTASDAETSAASSEGGDSTGAPVVGWFELGWGATEFNPLHDGDTLQVVWGGQGAAMFPLPLRGGEFVLPDPPDDYESELAPLFDLTIDIEGHDDGVGGHFKYLANYPITFEILPDGSYEFVYVAVLLPEDIDPSILDGLPAHLHARLRPYGSAPLELDLDLVVAGAEAPG
ncbi:MAG: hypothetical protein K1X88_02850 [Nannocystaceae bacterium]|nr:hypothetical protein [Nannocystaceae bacterium]